MFTCGVDEPREFSELTSICRVKFDQLIYCSIPVGSRLLKQITEVIMTKLKWQRKHLPSILQSTQKL